MDVVRFLQENQALFLTLVIFGGVLCIIFIGIIIIRGMQKDKNITKAAEELSEIANSIGAGIVNFVLEDNCKILYASQGFYEMLGYTENESILEGKKSILDFICEEDREKLLKTLYNQKSDKISFEVRLVTKDDRIIYCFVNGNKQLNKDKRHVFSIMLNDFTKQKEMQSRLLLEGERYKVAAELSNDVLFEYDIIKDTIFFMGKYKDFFGRDSVITNFLGRTDIIKKLVNSKDVGIFETFCKALASGRETIEAQFRMRDKMGKYIWCQVKGKTIFGDKDTPLRVIGTIVNINLHKREQEALEYKATRDPLTGVYNREATNRKINMFINGNKDGQHALMFFDFDDFKNVNDNFGHIQGDKILQFVVERIRSVFNDGEIIGRVGGDEFVVFIGNFIEPEEVNKKAKLLLHAMDTTYIRDGKSIPLSGSIGISTYPNDGNSYNLLAECADKACYEVKSEGKNNYKLYASAI